MHKAGGAWNEARFPKVITTVQCSICSQLNNKPRVVSPSLWFYKWLLLEAYLQLTRRHIIIRMCTNTPT